MQGWRMPDMRVLFYLAILGLISAAILAVGGIGFLIWFVVNHVQIV